jgi:hypothetical protein
MQGFFRIARHVALIALIARALVPTGWMPDAHGITICSVQTPGVTTTLGVIHHDGQPDNLPGGKHDNTNQECPFAATAHMAAVPDAPSLAAPSAHAIAAAADRAYAAAIIARFVPQSPRAPPQTV